MKLLHKTVLFVLLAMLPVGIVGGWLQHNLIHSGMLRDLDEQLARRLIHLKERRKKQPNLPIQLLGLESDIEIKPIGSGLYQPPVYATLIKHGSQHQLIKVRTLTATITMLNQNYRVVLKEVYDELDNTIWNISVSVVVAFLVLLIMMSLTILLISRYLWKPFYRLIDQLQHYRIDHPFEIVIPPDNITEFNKLGHALANLTRYANNQFAAQRQFSENASHEIQTPLAIALSHLDALMQANYLQEKELVYAYHAKEALQRLSNLSNGLLLLTKIDNQQYRIDENIDATQLLTGLVSMYQEFAQYRKLTISATISPNVSLRGHSYLLEILFSNLIKNAIRHNIPDGRIHLTLTKQQFTIQNTGNPPPFSPEQIFDRFIKDPTNQESTGLGLAIVKQIANLHDMKVAYNFQATYSLHEFQLTLNGSVRLP